MPIRCQGRHATAWGALQKALLNQKRFDHIFDGVALFTNAGGNVVQPHRATIKTMDDRFKQFAVHQVKALRVHIQHGQGSVGHGFADQAIGFHLGVVAHAAQQTVGDARRAT